MARAEDFTGPFDTGEEHLRRDGEIDEILFLFPHSAVVAHAATSRSAGFAEIIQQGDAAAEVRFSKSHELAQEDIGHPLFLFRFLSDKELNLLNIPVAEQKKTVGGQAIPSRPSDLLVVVVDAPRAIVMDNKPDIGFVEPH